MSTALSKLSSMTFENGGWYYVKRGWVGSNKETYFYQYSGPSYYNLNVQITLTSYKSTLYTDAAGTVKTTQNSDGTTSYTHLCQTRPKQGINACNYIMDVNNNIVKWSTTLVSWT